METVAEVIPFTAWQQAVFVVLFIMFVIGLLTWFTKQSDKWQSFMLTIDEKWREFNKEQRFDNNCQMKEVNASLSDLAQVTQGLVNEVKEMRSDSQMFYNSFIDHDEQAKEILMKVSKPTRAPRANRNQTNSNKEQ